MEPLIDRYYIETFLAFHSDGIVGRVLEVGDNRYTRRFGGERVKVSDVLNPKDGIAGTTLIADLAVGTQLPSDAFDCVIVTQTLHLIYEFSAAIRTLYRILKPGERLLLTSPGTMSQLGPGEREVIGSGALLRWLCNVYSERYLLPVIRR